MSPDGAPGEVTMPRPTSSRAWSGPVARAMVSIAALAFVIWRVDLAAVARSFSGLDWRWMLLAAVSVYAAIVVSAFKWGVLLWARGHALPLVRLFRHYLVGLFFNNFLPTSVGGDVVRAWDAGRDIEDAPEGAASVITERIIASVGLACTAALGLPFVDVPDQAYMAVAAVAVVGIGLAALFCAPSLSERMVASSLGGRFESVSGWARRATRAVGALLRRPALVISVLALSIVFQVIVALVNWCIFNALGVEVSLGACVVYTSIVSAITMIPVSISGHGVRELGYAHFFALAGVAEGVAVTASLLFFATVAVSTLPGAALFATGRRRRA